MKIEKAGTLAEASLLVNGIFEACEAAAAQYLENIKQMQEETAARCEEIIDEAHRKAEQISKNNEMIKKLMGDYYNTTNEKKTNQEF